MKIYYQELAQEKMDIGKYQSKNIMEVDFLKEKRKIIFAILIVIISASLIFAIKKEYYTMAKIESYDNDFATLKIAKTSYIINGNEENKPQNDNINIKKNDEVNIKNDGSNSINSNLKNNKINFIHKFKKLKIKDITAPEKVENVKVQTFENGIAINFDEPKDIGTNYNYKIKNSSNICFLNSINNYLLNNSTNENFKILNFYSESGVKGYYYEINENSENAINTEVNDIKSAPIILTNDEMNNLNFKKDLYLHIKTVDSNLNVSDCATIKLLIPSGGVEVKYIDLNSNEELKEKEFINGNVNDTFDISNKIPNIDGYKIVSNLDDLKGKFERNQKVIEVKFAKIKNVKIQYLDEKGSKIKEDSNLESYEGEKLKVEIPQIKNYKFKSGPKEFETKSDENENVVKLYYTKIESQIKNSNSASNNTNETRANLEDKTYETTYDEVDPFGRKRNVHKKVTRNDDGSVTTEFEINYY